MYLCDIYVCLWVMYLCDIYVCCLCLFMFVIHVCFFSLKLQEFPPIEEEKREKGKF